MTRNYKLPGKKPAGSLEADIEGLHLNAVSPDQLSSTRTASHSYANEDQASINRPTEYDHKSELLIEPNDSKIPYDDPQSSIRETVTSDRANGSSRTTASVPDSDAAEGCAVGSKPGDDTNRPYLRAPSFGADSSNTADHPCETFILDICQGLACPFLRSVDHANASFNPSGETSLLAIYSKGLPRELNPSDRRILEADFNWTLTSASSSENSSSGTGKITQHDMNMYLAYPSAAYRISGLLGGNLCNAGYTNSNDGLLNGLQGYRRPPNMSPEEGRRIGYTSGYHRGPSIDSAGRLYNENRP